MFPHEAPDLYAGMQKTHMDTTHALVIAAKTVGRKNELEIHLILSFPRLPCLLSLEPCVVTGA